MTKKILPELLSPAGSKEAFMAAIDGGADAIYLGGTSFNARINAKNLTNEELAECVKIAHTYGVKVYVTLNTLLFDKEREGFLSFAEDMAKCGTDAFIVADTGAASLIHAHMPEMELHASTQLSVHNSLAGDKLKSLGFSRLVPARELSLGDIKTLVDKNPLEVEIFVHGALCVSHSGQCLFSSIVGGRSGNRGECAQPCRLPYTCRGGCQKTGQYPLSLKDLSLANHVTDIIDSGVHSLKIEGRMKSPEYVRAVTSIWRKLLDEYRNATPEEMKQLADIFSRGGFTDGYFTGRINKSMLGVRSDSDKTASGNLQKFTGLSRKIPINAEVTIKENEPSVLKLICGNTSVTTCGEVAQKAENLPIDKDRVLRCISKFGNTPFTLENIDVTICGEVTIPVSSLNNLRRTATEQLIDVLTSKIIPYKTDNLPQKPTQNKRELKIGRFLFKSQITDTARKYFDKIFLPLDRYESIADGFVMPPVILDSEIEKVKELINSAKENGATCAIVGNIGNLKLLENQNIEIFGDYRFNVTNNYTVSLLEGMNIKSITLSPELSIPQLRDIDGDTSVIVYGRLPLMTLEKCVIRDLYGCSVCDKYTDCRQKNQSAPAIELIDRKGVSFPVIREWQHRNVIYNSLPTCMSEKQEELNRAKIKSRVFIFTTENAREVDDVIRAFKSSAPLAGKTRRI